MIVIKQSKENIRKKTFIYYHKTLGFLIDNSILSEKRTINTKAYQKLKTQQVK